MATLLVAACLSALGCSTAEETPPKDPPALSTGGAGGSQMTPMPTGTAGGGASASAGAGAGGEQVTPNPDPDAGGSGGTAGMDGGVDPGPDPDPIKIDLGPKPNVLLIMVDDLNDWAGYLGGHPQARTPNLDALAKKSFAFHRAYANSPSCNPSRASMMLGKYPHSIGIYSNQETGITPSKTINMREHFPDAVTLPQYFNKQGYSTFRSGKVFHYFGDWGDAMQTVDLSFETTNSGGGVKAGARWPLSGINWEYEYIDWGAFDQPYTDFEPYIRASIIEAELKKERTKPFFIAAGFYLPHLPWYYPKSLLDDPALAHIKNVEDVQLPKLLPDDINDLSAPGVRLAASADSKPKSLDGTISYESWHDAITTTGKWKEAVQAYLASIYFTDMQLGRILTTLEASPYAKNTIIVLVGDHGWMLGEKGAWSKYKPWEDSVRTHFLIHAPGSPGRRIDTPVGLVNLYRTLVDLAGLPEKADLDGRSLRPLLEGTDPAWDHPVVSVHEDWNKGWQSVRDKQYRLIRYYVDGSEELYDHVADPDEWKNLAKDPKFADVKTRLGAHLQDTLTPTGTWKPATP